MSNSLPPISILISDCAVLFKKTAWAFIKLLFVHMAIMILAVAIVGATLIQQGGAYLILFLPLLFLVATSFQACSVLTVAKYEGKAPLMNVLKEGVTYIIPLLIANFFSFFLVVGGVFLFVVPGIVLSILVTFVLYEVVLEHKRALPAVQASVDVVAQHFWSIVGRVVLFLLANIAIGVVLQLVVKTESGAIVRLFQAIVVLAIHFILSALATIFSTVVYRQAKAASTSRPTSITWIWIVAIVGWLIATLLGMSIYGKVMKMVNNSEPNSGFESSKLFNEVLEHDNSIM